MDWRLVTLLVVLTAPQVVVQAMSTPPLSQVVPSGGVAVGQAQAAGGTLGYVQATGGDAGAGYVQAAGRQSQQEEAASADSDQGFMQDIGFSQFFNDVGLQSSGVSSGVGSFSSPVPKGQVTPSQTFLGSLGAGGELNRGHFGGVHLGFDFGAAATQQQSKTDQGKDSAVQGFIPSNPLSFTGYPFGYSSSPPGTSPYALPSFRPTNHQASLPDSSPSKPRPAPRRRQNHKKSIQSCDHSESHCSPQHEDTHHTPQHEGKHHSTPSYTEASSSSPHYDVNSHDDPQYKDNFTLSQYDGQHSPEYEEEEHYAPTHQDQGPAHHYQEKDDSSGRHDHPEAHLTSSGEDSGSHDHCRTVKKDSMTCEVCEDNEGGFSEHCSNARRRGKDFRYANSRQGGHRDHGPDVHPAGYNTRRSEAGSSPVYVPRVNLEERQPKAQSRIDEVYSRPRHVEDFGREVAYDPFPDGSGYDPYSDADRAESRYEIVHDEVVLEDDPGDHDYDYDFYHSNEGEGNERSQVQNKEEEVLLPAAGEQAFPLKRPDNYARLTKMMTRFSKRDRSSCKMVEKRGMVCYLCQDPEGEHDQEECMYARHDPDGHQIMYSEERSYGTSKAY